MAEGGGSSNNSVGASIIKMIGYFIVVCMILLFAQVYISEPESRARKACWPPYLAAKFVMVDALGALMPTGHTLLLKNTMRTEQFYIYCTGKLTGLPGFEQQKPQQRF